MSNLKNPPKPKKYEHPSYGLIQFNRVTHSGTTRLFGSSLDSHRATIQMSVMRGCFEHDLNHDRYYANGQSPMIEVELSAVQFCEAITTMNHGSGVPCTLRSFNFKSIDDPPDIETEVERIKSKFGDELNDMVKVLKEQRVDIEALTAKLPDKSKLKLRIALDVMIQQLTSNIPFILEQFNEASDRVVTTAKHEIEAFALHALHALAGKQLDSGEDMNTREASATPEQLQTLKKFLHALPAAHVDDEDLDEE